MIRPLSVRCALLLGSVALIASGCGDQAESPTAPEATPALSVSSAAALSFRNLSAGVYHTCGVTTEDQAYCWGDGRLRPTLVSGGLRFIEVSAGQPDDIGESTTCGITRDFHAYCWGRDLVPSEVPGGRRFRQISVGLKYACGVNPLDVAFCWGVNNQWGELGTGGGFSTTPARVAGGLRFRRVFAAATHTCGTTTADRAYCWGWNNFGQLGTTLSGISQPKPVLVAGGLSFRQAKPGSGYPTGINDLEVDGPAYSCGVTTGDRAYCWGGPDAPLGSATASSRTPIPVAGGRLFNFVHPGLQHACALTPFNNAFCWGSNQYGQLGNGSTSFSTTPVRVSGGLKFVSITVAPTGWHGCGVTLDHRAYCWGRNYSGGLGDGTTTTRLTPTPVIGPL